MKKKMAYQIIERKIMSIMSVINNGIVIMKLMIMAKMKVINNDNDNNNNGKQNRSEAKIMSIIWYV